VPIGLAAFANDFQSIRRLAERDHRRVVQWNRYDVGGHYAAHQAPDCSCGTSARSSSACAAASAMADHGATSLEQRAIARHARPDGPCAS
jgi:hypothetical protein